MQNHLDFYYNHDSNEVAVIVELFHDYRLLLLIAIMHVIRTIMHIKCTLPLESSA